MSRRTYDTLIPGRIKATAAITPDKNSNKKFTPPSWACTLEEEAGIIEIPKTTAIPKRIESGTFQVNDFTFACRRIIGIPPTTAPIKKYIVCMGNLSIRWERGVANNPIPRTAPIQKQKRKKKCFLFSFRKELTDTMSLS